MLITEGSRHEIWQSAPMQVVHDLPKTRSDVPRTYMGVTPINIASFKFRKLCFILKVYL